MPMPVSTRLALAVCASTLALLLAPLPGCRPKDPPAAPAATRGAAPAPSPGHDATGHGRAAKSKGATLLATVNGAPIRAADVDLLLSNKRHGLADSPKVRQDILQGIIQHELIRQRAMELGLDDDEEYLAGLHQREAQLNAYQRKALYAAFLRREVEGKMEITEAQGRAYLEAHGDELRSSFHVWQILRKSEAAITEDLRDLQAGKKFEEVAQQRFSKLKTDGGRFWDLGYLQWSQLPEPWQKVIPGLGKGQLSGIIRGPRDRFWIIKVLDRRQAPEATYEALAPRIKALLQRQAVTDRLEKLKQELRQKAKIEIMRR